MSQPNHELNPDSVAMPFRDALREARALLEKAAVAPDESSVAAAAKESLDEALSKLATRAVRGEGGGSEGGDPRAQALANAVAAAKKRDLLSVICHDLKDPLASIVMGAGFLQKVLPKDGSVSSARRVVDAIYRSANRMNAIIQDFYDLGKLEQGLITISPRPLDVASLVRAAVDSQRDAATEKHIALELDVPETIPPLSAVYERARIVTVLQKLLGNAIKFTGDGGRVTVRVEPRGAEVMFRVADTGRGISDERKPTIFDREANARQVPRDGPGLGLAIAKALVELHRGTIGVESKVGEGSTFFFTLPRELPQGSA